MGMSDGKDNNHVSTSVFISLQVLQTLLEFVGQSGIPAGGDHRRPPRRQCPRVSPAHCPARVFAQWPPHSHGETGEHKCSRTTIWPNGWSTNFATISFECGLTCERVFRRTRSMNNPDSLHRPSLFIECITRRILHTLLIRRFHCAYGGWSRKVRTDVARPVANNFKHTLGQEHTRK
ncbi:hypothetical protein BD410DRAFT_120958 [Rickenella mellea]|uniref:Uncharacterized protein n=1 Tax=Rickenella mellea TaxID=50990 RepID=A0A4Y7PK57_9AGAM|nr:hypothetical protein BD410DRAFT_120958 [Rickenella mellea]